MRNIFIISWKIFVKGTQSLSPITSDIDSTTKHWLRWGQGWSFRSFNNCSMTSVREHKLSYSDSWMINHFLLYFYICKIFNLIKILNASGKIMTTKGKQWKLKSILFHLAIFFSWPTWSYYNDINNYFDYSIVS